MSTTAKKAAAERRVFPLERLVGLLRAGTPRTTPLAGMVLAETDKADALMLDAADELERIDRNRDMWKGQVARQAEQIESLRAEGKMLRGQLERVGRWVKAFGNTYDELALQVAEALQPNAQVQPPSAPGVNLDE